jgi:hypothetical protein
VLPSFGSVALDLAVLLLARLARQFSNRPARDGLALAPERLVSDLKISITWSLARWTPQHSSEVRHLIGQMTRENFLWGPPQSMANFC